MRKRLCLVFAAQYPFGIAHALFRRCIYILEGVGNAQSLPFVHTHLLIRQHLDATDVAESLQKRP